ncbi:hypothetical protein BAUCODRAFT_23917 [Baudoinia panamericana UAMH 10762]|uniref:TAP-C domain-containing protein n=1 Tax=Baudoinia panamericana (strain UAMH 10762) TaxID=717646 RepID=M2NFB0_BAUPA|nr:uncharacterized protein BAUCODRAFT_23917 [Baudoinia panamericana UAMH 10762]EMC97670.1 hypothetical protein BAUCODRAFT_23917 [Baudoinia panamericana UAMH 10762]
MIRSDQKWHVIDEFVAPSQDLPFQQAPFGRLAAELRNSIYECALIEDAEIDVTSFPRTYPTPGLLHTCRQLRSEATAIYYSRNCFLLRCFKVHNPALKWVFAIRQEQARFLRRIKVKSEDARYPNHMHPVLKALAITLVCRDAIHFDADAFSALSQRLQCETSTLFEATLSSTGYPRTQPDFRCTSRSSIMVASPCRACRPQQIADADNSTAEEGTSHVLSPSYFRKTTIEEFETREAEGSTKKWLRELDSITEDDFSTASPRAYVGDCTDSVVVPSCLPDIYGAYNFIENSARDRGFPQLPSSTHTVEAACLVALVARATDMTIEYAFVLLNRAGWKPERARRAYSRVQEELLAALYNRNDMESLQSRTTSELALVCSVSGWSCEHSSQAAKRAGLRGCHRTNLPSPLPRRGQAGPSDKRQWDLGCVPRRQALLRGEHAESHYWSYEGAMRAFHRLGHSLPATPYRTNSNTNEIGSVLHVSQSCRTNRASATEKSIVLSPPPGLHRPYKTFEACKGETDGESEDISNNTVATSRKTATSAQTDSSHLSSTTSAHTKQSGPSYDRASGTVQLNEASLSLPPFVGKVEAAYLVGQLAFETRLTTEYAFECLNRNGWNYDNTMRVYKGVKHLLPRAAVESD